VARLLLDAGADASVPNGNGDTPLYLASEGGHEAVARLLLDAGADASVADGDGRTPLHRASEGGHKAVARLLRNRIRRTIDSNQTTLAPPSSL